MEANDGEFAPNEEVDELVWVPLESVRANLTWRPRPGTVRRGHEVPRAARASVLANSFQEQPRGLVLRVSRRSPRACPVPPVRRRRDRPPVVRRRARSSSRASRSTSWCPCAARSRRRSSTSPTSDGSKRARHLVEQEQRRLHGQRSHDRDALLLTARESIRVVVGAIAQTDAIEQCQGLVVDVARAFAFRARTGPTGRSPARSGAGRD